MKLSESNSLLTSMRPPDILEFQDRLFHVLREKPSSCWHFIIVFAPVFVAVAVSNPSLRHLLPFHLSYVAISKRYCLLEFYPDIASLPHFSSLFLFWPFSHHYLALL